MKRVLKRGVRSVKRLFKLHRVAAIAITVGIVGLIVGGGVYASLGGAPKDAASGDVDLQKGLVGWWKLDGNAKDATPYGNNGTVTGATLTTDRKSKSNAGYSFDGNDDVTFTDQDYFSPFVNDLSISFWARVPSSAPAGGGTCGGTGRYIVSKGNGSNEWEWNFKNVSNTSICFAMYDPTGGTIHAQTSYSMTMNDNTWHHYAVTIDYLTNVSMYVDGVLRSTDTTFSSSMGNQAQPLQIGRRGDGNYFVGDIDDVRIYNRVINSAEISALYNTYGSGVSAASGEKGLLGWWKMDGNPKDSSPYANGLTLSGTTPPALTTDRQGRANSAYTFDGSTSTASAPNAAGKFIPTDNAPFSISLYLKPTGPVSDPSFIAIMSNETYNTTGFRLMLNSAAKIRFSTVQSGGTIAINGATSIVAGSWYHLAITFDGTTALMYLNGVQDGSGTGTILANTNPISLSNISGTAKIQGVMDDVRIYDRLLTVTEIGKLYSSYGSEVKVSDLQKGLVGYWPLNGNAKDATPYGNNGTVTAATLTTDLKGRANSAYSFNGSTTYIDAGTGASLNINGSVSVFAWIKPTTIHDTNNYIFSRRGSSGTRGYALYLNNTADHIRAYVVNAGGGAGDFDGTTTIVPGTWYHVGFTSDGTTMKLFVNGVQDGSGGSISVVSTSINAYIGVYNTITAAWTFDGSIDDVRVYDRALTAPEAKALYDLYK